MKKGWHTLAYTVKLMYSGHPWDVANWLLYKGGLSTGKSSLGHY